jgi:hypothetical protein
LAKKLSSFSFFVFVFRFFFAQKKHWRLEREVFFLSRYTTREPTTQMDNNAATATTQRNRPDDRARLAAFALAEAKEATMRHGSGTLLGTLEIRLAEAVAEELAGGHHGGGDAEAAEVCRKRKRGRAGVGGRRSMATTIGGQARTAAVRRAVLRWRESEEDEEKAMSREEGTGEALPPSDSDPAEWLPTRWRHAEMWLRAQPQHSTLWTLLPRAVVVHWPTSAEDGQAEAKEKLDAFRSLVGRFPDNDGQELLDWLGADRPDYVLWVAGEHARRRGLGVFCLGMRMRSRKDFDAWRCLSDAGNVTRGVLVVCCVFARCQDPAGCDAMLRCALRWADGGRVGEEDGEEEEEDESDEAVAARVFSGCWEEAGEAVAPALLHAVEAGVLSAPMGWQGWAGWGDRAERGMMCARHYCARWLPQREVAVS